jgi:hypothetical protein
MILVALIKSEMQINWASDMFNNLHTRLKDLGDPNKSSVTQAAKFGGTQILDIVF